MLETPSKYKWQRIGTERRAGIMVPLFSVYSRKSIGIGNFSDLSLLVDFCRKTNNSIIQLLPINEMGQMFCPYDAVSSFALEPVYISLGRIKAGDSQKIREEIERLKINFPVGSTHVDFKIRAEKLRLLRQIHKDDNSYRSRDFNGFIEGNSYWLPDVALFKALKAYQEQRPWYEWEEPYKRRDAAALEDFSSAHAGELDFEIWLQWQLYNQLKEAKSYAEKKNVLIKGDLPLLVSRDSADVWAHPEFFKLEFASGAPPDMYSAKGQRWGMPPYNWEAIAADGYRYLKEKLRYAENFYDILRIDHVVGLFRIWSIPYAEPLENQGLNGFFDPGDEKVWGRHGRDLLSVINNSTKMLICAEDLGVIPQLCRDTLRELGIPGNEVQRWVKDWKIKHDFLDFRDYRLMGVAMLSTHDTTNWPAWWENEAGTVDEALFIRKCRQKCIDYGMIKEKLFDLSLSSHGRLRWLEEIKSLDILLYILGRKKEEVADIIELYENSYREKEKLWRRFGANGPMPEKPGAHIIAFALKMTLDSHSIFCIQSLIDWLFLGGILNADPYEYRINTPGTVSKDNWSLVIPASLEELLTHRLCNDMKGMIVSSDRI